ncbi:MAG: metallophosphoesterase [Planctomycetia bacterium]|nr:metallophosphoesterase [Planctomycetia bacterium]
MMRKLLTRSLLILLANFAAAAHLASHAHAEVPTTVRGRVILDLNGNGQLDAGDQGLADVAIHDGVNIVTTAKDGTFEIKVADDPVLPFLPSRVVAMSWPSGMWPSSLWYRRLADMKPGEELLFALKPEQQQLPLVFVQSTDPHNSYADDLSRLWRAEIAQLMPAPKFCIITGDLGYATIEGAEGMFSSVQNYARTFPIPMLLVPGNHDLVGILGADWNKPTELHGNGAYTKYLGPIRWSFSWANLHFVGLDWSSLDKGILSGGQSQAEIDWLDKDLSRLKPGTRIFLFSHSHWSPIEKFYEVMRKHKIELFLAGHSHQNLDLSSDGLKMLTTVNLRMKEGPYRLIHISDGAHDIVDRCLEMSGRHSKTCNILVPLPMQALRRKQVDVPDATLENRAQAVGDLAANWLEVDTEVTPETARRCGVRIISTDPAVAPLEISLSDNLLICGTVVNPTVRAAATDPFRLTIHAINGRVMVRSNGRVHFEKPFPTDKPCRAELFAVEGRARFAKVSAWPLAHDDAAGIAALVMHHKMQGQERRAAEYQAVCDRLSGVKK